MTENVIDAVLVAICSMTVFLTSMRFLRRYVELKHDRRAVGSTDTVSERLQRIEQIVETTALEVERMSEANRFMAKLLAERSGSMSVGNRPEKVITPH